MVLVCENRFDGKKLPINEINPQAKKKQIIMLLYFATDNNKSDMVLQKNIKSDTDDQFDVIF